MYEAGEIARSVSADACCWGEDARFLRMGRGHQYNAVNARTSHGSEISVENERMKDERTVINTTTARWRESVSFGTSILDLKP